MYFILIFFFVILAENKKIIYSFNIITCRRSSINCFLSPLNFAEGLGKYLLAFALSLFKAERHLLKTASPIRVTGTP